MTSIVWFRQDLRLRDNPALSEAARAGAIVPVFILDEEGAGPVGHRSGAASRWWLHHSLGALRAELGGLVLLRGEPKKVLEKLIAATGAGAVYWNRCYEPHIVARDKSIKTSLQQRGIAVRSFNASLLHEPWEVRTQGGEPFKVYSPFWKSALKREIAAPLPRPAPTFRKTPGLGDDLDDWHLLPAAPDWAAGWQEYWQPGEAGALACCSGFLKQGLEGYASLRDRPDLQHVSRLSPHLHFGEISPRQIWSAVQFAKQSRPEIVTDADKFLSEIGWREFSHSLLYHFPELPERNWRRSFDAYPWRTSASDLKAWQRGMTGYPLVDAGMRELWHTGFMHNRVRMVAASFLVKHLRIDWRQGAAWFWDTLVDADLANNSASWQWVAGSGADAAPYFRIFNPMAQGRKFDPEAAYVRRWCPELSRLDAKLIHAPFLAPADVLDAAGVRLGETYPRPIVEHGEARLAALAGYDAVRAAKPV